MDVYAETILDHYRHPRGKRAIASPTVEHAEINLSCGDQIKLQLKIEDGTIVDIGWDGTGCAISQAAMSLVAEELLKAQSSKLDGLSLKDIYDLLGVPIGPRRTKCALLCLHALKNALHKMKNEPMQGWSETVG